MKKRLLVPVSVLLAAVLALAACGGAEDEARPAVAPVPATPAATAAPAVAVPATAAPAVAVATAAMPGAGISVTVVPARAAAGDVIYGGTLNIPTYADWSAWDMHQISSSNNIVLWGGIYNTLLRWDLKVGDKIEPWLAKSWDLDGSGVVWTLNLEEGVEFSDGTPFTADDVVWNFDKWINPPEGMVIPRHSILPDLFESWRAVDDNTVEVTTTYPAATFLPEMASGFHLMLGEDNPEPSGPDELIGTGPWLYKAHERGNFGQLQKNPNYWEKDAEGNELPYADNKMVFILPEVLTMVAAFRTKRLHMSEYGFSPPILEVERIREELPEVIIEEIIGFPHHMNFNHDIEPWSDARVRRAVFLAFDRQKQIETGLAGPADIIAFYDPIFGIPEEELLTMPGFRQPKDADIAEAISLLASAGYPDGFKTTVQGTPGRSREAVNVQEDLAKIGIEVSIEPKDWTSLLASLSKGDFEIGILGTGMLYYDPDSTNGMLYLPGAGRNFGNWQPPQEWMDLYDLEKGETDPNIRQGIVRQMEEIMIDEVPHIMFFHERVINMWWPEFKGYNLTLLPDFNQIWWSEVWLSE